MAHTHVLATGLSLNSESRRHREARVAHFGEACAFAAENIFHLAVAIGLAAAECINVLGRWSRALRWSFCFCNRHCRHKCVSFIQNSELQMRSFRAALPMRIRCACGKPQVPDG